MRRSQRSRWGVALLAAALLGPVAGPRPAAASFEETANASQRVADSAFDLILLRPLSGAALVVGSAFFVAAAPFVAPFEGLRSAWGTFVYAPYDYAIKRDLGDF